jgi:hypothetical protein
MICLGRHYANAWLSDNFPFWTNLLRIVQAMCVYASNVDHFDGMGASHGMDGGIRPMDRVNLTLYPND